VTRHLRFAMPYRALFSRTVRPDTLPLILDALAALLVRLHMAGFFWGDCSLSNALFRRDAGGFSAYLVDAETGELHDELSYGQRLHDVDLARTNIIGELMDLEAGGLLDVDLDPFEIGETILFRYLLLWAELTEPETIPEHEHYRIEQRVRRLNHRRGRSAAADPAHRRRPGAPPAPAAAPDRPGRGGEPGPPPARRPRPLPG
jgi:hypothetical protein